VVVVIADGTCGLLTVGAVIPVALATLKQEDKPLPAPGVSLGLAKALESVV
jgi:hypothetical protein